MANIRRNEGWGRRRKIILLETISTQVGLIEAVLQEN